MLELTEFGLRGAPVVVLFHGAASHSGQWRALIQRLSPHYRVLAFNQFGYGRSPRWSGSAPMTYADQASPVLEVLHKQEGPLHLVGHSHGASLAALVACELTERLASLALYEPNAFRLLTDAQGVSAEERAAFERARRSFGDLEAKRADPSCYPQFAEELLEFWLGRGAWAQLPERVREQLVEAMPPTIAEVHAALYSPISLEPLRAARERVLLMYDPQTPPVALAVTERVKALLRGCATSEFKGCGHLAPIFHAERVNEVIVAHLQAHTPPASSAPRA